MVFFVIRKGYNKMIESIVRRDGGHAEFDIEKIAEAINKAASRTPPLSVFDIIPPLIFSSFLFSFFEASPVFMYNKDYITYHIQKKSKREKLSKIKAAVCTDRPA